jgi:glutamate-5-semialdehyde dehydrogenase
MEDGVKNYIRGIAEDAKKASRSLRGLTADIKNNALLRIADLMEKHAPALMEANGIDLARGKDARLSAALLDRLTLSRKRISDLAISLREIAAFEDPVGEIIGVRRPQGFVLEKVRTPIGVVVMIFESRPNVTVDAAALCLKSGNAVILRGGSEALESNKALVGVIGKGLEKSAIPARAVQLIERKEYEAIDELVAQEGLVDLVIPRGGEALIRRVVENATVPVIKHYRGVCHLFVDESADLDMALEVVTNSKVQRPATCNALEKVLVHEAVASDFLPRLRVKMPQVELRVDPKAARILGGQALVKNGTEEDWHAEYLDLILGVRVVSGLDEAIDIIETYGSAHTDGILSRDAVNIRRFVGAVDSAVLTVNASTRLADGGVFGLGAEIGISTDKLHARGPMGLKELTTYKWVVRGDGDLRR